MRTACEVPENVRFVPNVTIETRRPGAPYLEREVRARNLVVDNGISLLVDLIGGTGFRPSHIELGTGTTAADPLDTVVETPEFRAEITARDKLVKAIQFQLFLGLNDGNGFTYTEAGLFETGLQNSAPGDPGILVARALFSPVIKNNSIELTVTWTINVAAV